MVSTTTSRSMTALVLIILTLLIKLPAFAEQENAHRTTETAYVVQRDIEYARVDAHRLLFDLYLPRHGKNWPLVVWIHGGAWRKGSKANMPLKQIVAAGYAVASIDYRLSTTAIFPAQIHDCKAALRFLRAQADVYSYDATRIAVAGSSAGGHLAALVGTTNGHKQLEGSLGNCREQSAAVQAIVDYYGPTNFETILKQSTPHGLGVRVPALELLLGGSLEEKKDMARLASPVQHVDADDPPLLIFHGDQDPQVPINQSHELQARYQASGLPVQFEVVHGAAHGGDAFYDPSRISKVKAFLDQQIAAPR